MNPATAPAPLPGVVVDAVSRIMTQAKLPEEFRKDFEKEVAAVYAAGLETDLVKSAPLSDAEIAAFRDAVRALAAK